MIQVSCVVKEDHHLAQKNKSDAPCNSQKLSLILLIDFLTQSSKR